MVATQSKIHTRRYSTSLTMGILLIGLAVFGWGVQSKVSLYDAPGGNALVVKAKLLSPKERLAPLQAVTLSTPDLKTPMPTLSAFVAVVCVGLCGVILFQRPRTLSTGRPQVERYFVSAYFSFRPPPAGFLPRT